MITDHLATSLLSRIGAGRPLEQAIDRKRWEEAVGADALAYIETFLQQEVYSLPLKSRAAVARRLVDRARVVLDTREDAGVELPYWVYLLYGPSGVLLYVGTTSRGPVRLVQHYRDKWWFRQVARVEIERYPSRLHAIRREASLIRGRSPVYNVQHNEAVSR